jgi:hypothetical protein
MIGSTLNTFGKDQDANYVNTVKQKDNHELEDAHQGNHRQQWHNIPGWLLPAVTCTRSVIDLLLHFVRAKNGSLGAQGIDKQKTTDTGTFYTAAEEVSSFQRNEQRLLHQDHLFSAWQAR